MLKLVDFLAKNGKLSVEDESVINNVPTIGVGYVLHDDVSVSVVFSDSKVTFCAVEFDGRKDAYCMKAENEEMNDDIVISFIKECCFDNGAPIGATLIRDVDHVVPLSQCSHALFDSLKAQEKAHCEYAQSMIEKIKYKEEK